MRYHEIMIEGLAPLYSDALEEDDQLKCQQALEIVQTKLQHKGLARLLTGPLRFSGRPIMGQHGHYDSKTDTVTLDATWYSADDLAKALVHELGHRLQNQQSIFKRMSIFWRFFEPDASPNEYGRQNQYEMFAELFRYYIYDLLTERQQVWMRRFLTA